MNTITSSSSLLLSFLATSSTPSSSSTTHHPKLPSCPSPSPSRFFCRTQNQPNPSKDLPFVLHHALHSSGIDVSHAREAREGYCEQVGRLSRVERETSVCINRKVDLAKTALFVAAEDDALVSHSSVALPVGDFVRRLDDMSMEFCRQFSSSFRASPEVFLENLEKYLYGYKGFQIAAVPNLPESRDLYLHSVLTHRSGSAVMLSLIYSEILKMLRMWSLLDFDVEIYCPSDESSLPTGYPKQKSQESDYPHILTTESLLVQILRNLKEAFWPFRHDPSGSLFLRAACAAKCASLPNTVEETGFERASAKAAQHRLERGIWTSVRLGDMRRALSASERLILLDHDLDELRDYSVLLYHCGFYEQSLHFLNLYKNSTSLEKRKSSNKLKQMEDDAVEKLKTRLNLILMEDNSTRVSPFQASLENTSEPW